MNYQNFPRGSDILKCFKARPGFTFFFFDYSQIELRFAAYYLSDVAWIEAFKNGEDVHTQTAYVLWGRKEKSKDERTFAKNFNFGMLYGAGVPRIARMLKELLSGTIEEHMPKAKEMLSRFHKKHPNIKGFQNLVCDRVMSDETKHEYFIEQLGWRGYPKRRVPYKGFIHNRFGRRYRIPPNVLYKALEWLTSGDATGDTHTEKFVEVSEYFELNNLSGGPCALKHDEIICEIKDNPYQYTHVNSICAIMENIPELTKVLPIKVDVECGKNWLEKFKAMEPKNYGLNDRGFLVDIAKRELKSEKKENVAWAEATLAEYKKVLDSKGGI